MNELEVKEIENQISIAGLRATELMIVDNIAYQQAGELLVVHKGLKKRIEDYFKPLKENAHKAWKSICNRENEETVKLEPAIKHLNS